MAVIVTNLTPTSASPPTTTQVLSPLPRFSLLDHLMHEMILSHVTKSSTCYTLHSKSANLVHYTLTCCVSHLNLVPYQSRLTGHEIHLLQSNEAHVLQAYEPWLAKKAPLVKIETFCNHIVTGLSKPCYAKLVLRASSCYLYT